MECSGISKGLAQETFPVDRTQCGLCIILQYKLNKGIFSRRETLFFGWCYIVNILFLFNLRLAGDTHLNRTARCWESAWRAKGQTSTARGHRSLGQEGHIFISDLNHAVTPPPQRYLEFYAPDLNGACLQIKH